MAITQTDEPTPQQPLRLWPGVVAVVLQWLARFGLPAATPFLRIWRGPAEESDESHRPDEVRTA